MIQEEHSWSESNGNLNAQWYITDMLTCDVHPFAQQVRQNFILQRDNARAHTVRVVVNHLAQNGITVIKWPACSPDLNTIEHMWDQLKQSIDREVQDNTTLVLAQLDGSQFSNDKPFPCT